MYVFVVCVFLGVLDSFLASWLLAFLAFQAPLLAVFWLLVILCTTYYYYDTFDGGNLAPPEVPKTLGITAACFIVCRGAHFAGDGEACHRKEDTRELPALRL